MEIVIATSNLHKVDEIRAILGGVGIEVKGLSDLPGGGELAEPAEDGETFEENARIKALAYARMTRRVCLADDSGLEVDALGGKPGVHSARYAGVGDTRAERDAANNRKLLEELEGVAREDRTARFVCCMCVARPDGRVVAESRGEFAGRIGFEARGSNGFGYDPLLVLEDGRTSAELSSAEKNARSHRGAAAREMARRLAARAEILLAPRGRRRRVADSAAIRARAVRSEHMTGKRVVIAERVARRIGVAVALCAGVASAGTLEFVASQTVDNVGRDARRCAVGHFNNDAHLDIAVALHAPGNGGDGQITLLLGDASGNFSTGTPIHCGRAGGGVLAAHLNGDSFLDLISTQAVMTAGGADSRCGSFIGSPVFFGNGDGTFTHATCLVAGLSPMSAAAGLLNGDGAVDVAIASRSGHGLSIFVGLGFGAFGTAAHVISADALSASDLAIADFNGGALDIALAHSNGVNMFLGVGDATFFNAGAVIADQSYLRVVSADFDGDGEADLAASAEFAGEIKVWRGTGSGTFFAPVTLALPAAASDLKAADVDGDMIPDLVAVSESAQTISIFVNDGMGAFGAREDLLTPGKWRAVAAGDWNGDLVIDLAGADDPDDDSSRTVVLVQMPPGGECDGDVDGSGAVNVNDISYVVFRLGMSGPPGTVDGDADGNGSVNVNDVSYVVFRLGTCG